MLPPDGARRARVLLFWRSLLAFTIAFLVAVLLHEGAHALTARAFGLHPALHHNYVSSEEDPMGGAAPRLWVPAAGPLASLVLGLGCLWWVRRRQAPGSMTSLTALWLGLMGHIAFFGYLMMGPLFAYGDSGKVYAVLGVPAWLAWALAVLGLAVLILIVRRTSPAFERQVPAALAAEARGPSANALIAYPLVAGAVLTALLSLPAPSALSLIHPLTSPFAVFLAYGRFRRSRTALRGDARYPAGLGPGWLLLLAALIASSRALVGGLRL